MGKPTLEDLPYCEEPLRSSPEAARGDRIGPMALDAEIEARGGRRLRSAVVRPEVVGPHPGVVVIHEVFGDQPEMRAVCDDFARHGYVAVMPDLFSGRGLRPICVARKMIDASRGKVNVDIEATRAWLTEQDDLDGDRIGVIGFCMGGGFALAYIAGGRPGVRAAAVNYGEVPKEESKLHGACAIVGSYGGKDKMLGRTHAERLSHHLEALGIEHDVKRRRTQVHDRRSPPDRQARVPTHCSRPSDRRTVGPCSRSDSGSMSTPSSSVASRIAGAAGCCRSTRRATPS